MCTGLEFLPMLSSALPGIAMSAAGAGVNAMIQNNAIEEQNRQNAQAMDREADVANAEQQRQRAMEADQRSVLAQALATVDPGQTAQSVIAAAPQTDIARAVEHYNLATLPGQNTEGASATAIGRIISDAMDRTGSILNAQAQLTGFGTSALDRQDALVNMGSAISTIGGRRASSAGVAQREAAIPAATVTPSGSIIGDALMLAGSGLAGRLAQRGGAPRVGASSGAGRFGFG